LLLEKQEDALTPEPPSSQRSTASSTESIPSITTSRTKSFSSSPVSSQGQLRNLSNTLISLYLNRKFCSSTPSREVLEDKLKEIGISDITCFTEHTTIFRVSYARARELLQTCVIIEVGGVPLLADPTHKYSYAGVEVKTDMLPAELFGLVPESSGLLVVQRCDTNPARLRLTFVDINYAKKFVENPPSSLPSHNFHFSLDVCHSTQARARLRYHDEVHPVKYIATSLTAENPLMISDRQALTVAFESQGWKVFYVSPEKNPRTGTVFFSDIRSAKKFLITWVSYGGFLLKPTANRFNEWYRVKIKTDASIP